MATLAPARFAFPAPSAPGRPRQWALLTLFYVLCPTMIALPLGWYQAGFGSELSRGASLGLWVSQWLIWWWTGELLFRGVRRALRPLDPRLPLLLITAAVGNLLLCRFSTPLFMEMFAAIDGRPAAARFPDLRRDLGDPGYLWTLVKSGWLGSLYWIALRGLYEVLVAAPGAPLGTPASATRDAPPLFPLPAFLDRLRGGRTDASEIVALEAEDHYVRVHFADRSELLHCRFSDAVAAMAGHDGARVHRSFWIRGTAVATAAFTGTSGVLTLSNGLKVPVSQRHRALVEGMLLSRRAT